MLVEPETVIPTAVIPAAAARSSPSQRRLRERDAHAVRVEAIGAALSQRRAELQRERAGVLTDLMAHRGVDAGDDIADLGTKAYAQEQEMLLVSGIQARIDQVERAMEQLAKGRYGWCERCSQEIPVARLAAFPAATQCVRCKRLEERR